MPNITPEYLATLEHLLYIAREFLARRAGIGDLRQAMQAASREQNNTTLEQYLEIAMQAASKAEENKVKAKL